MASIPSLTLPDIDTTSSAPAPPPQSNTQPSSAPPPPPPSTAPPSSAPAPPPSTAAPPPSTTTEAPETSTRVTTTSTAPSSSTSIEVVTVQSVITVSGSAVTTSVPSSSVVAVPANDGNGGGGLSSGAKTGIIAACSAIGGIALLALLIFLGLRWNRRRKANYVPGADEIKWPVSEAEADTLFPTAVRPTGGAGFLERDQSMRSTTAGTSYGGSSAQQHYGNATYPGAPAFAYTNNYEGAPSAGAPSTYNDHAQPQSYQQYADYSEYAPTEAGPNGMSSHGHDGYDGYGEEPYGGRGGANLDRGYSVQSARPQGNLNVVNRDSY